MARVTEWFGKNKKDLLAGIGSDWKCVYDGDSRGVFLGADGATFSVDWNSDGMITGGHDGIEHMDASCYGYHDTGKVYGSKHWVYSVRGFGAITSDRELLKYAERVSNNWYSAGWHHGLESFYLDSHEFSSKFTKEELARLKELKAEAIAKAKAADEAREWKYVTTIYWADNSVEEVWRDKNGIEKTVLKVGPHGDLC